jgi:hypothetical protein
MQLAYDCKISQLVRDLFHEHIPKRTRPTLQEVLQALQDALITYTKVFVVVDAFDECSETDKIGTIFLRELCQLQPRINILITSRYSKDGQIYVKDFEDFEIRAQDDDIENYIDSRIHLEPLLLQYINEEPVLKNDIVRIVCHKANGMYVDHLITSLRQV